MGKRGGQQWDGQEWDGYRSYSGWEESSAAMRPAKSKGKGKDQQRKKDEAAFPSYEAMILPTRAEEHGQAQASSSWEGPQGHGQRPGSMAKSIQKAVNNLRKCETRLRRIAEEQDEAQAKWRAFQEQLKKTFVKERAKFLAHTAKLGDEKAEQSALQDEAMEELQAVLSGTPVETEGATMAVDEAEHEWNGLMQDANAMDDLSTRLSGAMQDKSMQGDGMRQRLLQLLNLHKDKAAAPSTTSTPPRRSRTVIAMTPPAKDKPLPPGSEAAVAAKTAADDWLDGAMAKNPYPPSPSSAGQAHLASQAAERGPSRPRATAPRVPVKARTKPSPPAGHRKTLADKLEVSRASAPEPSSVTVPDSEEDLAEAKEMDVEPLTEVD